MYAASTASTTSSSGAVLSKGEVTTGLTDRRVRLIRLLRPRRSQPCFGFSLRGGREHNTGFFISKVEFNSEAHHQGLRVGDQLVSVNGWRVDDAVHCELAQFLATQTRLKIKVRNVGMIPVKEKAHDSLSWQFVSERTSLGSDASSSPTLCHDSERLNDLHLSILVPPRAKLGCGICKGPEWKPGIFVQFVREGGIAREAGLRPGDQIISCNNQDFTDIPFNDAIAAMKISGRLEIVVRPGAGSELVSPESSGYNSSASSAAGERSPAPLAPFITTTSQQHTAIAPPAALRRRLASVAEEAADRADRITIGRLKRRTWDSLDFDWKDRNIHNFDIPSDIEPDYDSPSIPNNPHSYENQIKNIRKKEFISNPSNRTIINLTENGATIECSYENQSPRKTPYAATLYQMDREVDKKTIVVEVHHTNCNNESSNYNNNNKSVINKEADSTSVSSTATLSNAIAEEIQRRKLKSMNIEKCSQDATKKKIDVKVDNEKKKQHDALMDEFKKMHHKMFANQDLKLNEDCDSQLVVHNKNIDKDRQQTLPLRKQNDMKNGHRQIFNGGSVRLPPPPPPMPVNEVDSIIEVNHNKDSKLGQMKNGISNILVESKTKNETIKRMPTPDYNKNDCTIIHGKTYENDAVDIESIESFKLKNPSTADPKPPSTYFIQESNRNTILKNQIRPVSVTIGEYPGTVSRKEPSKLEFIGVSSKPEVDSPSDTPITNKLHSELALTLSRSNLRKKIESGVTNGNI